MRSDRIISISDPAALARAALMTAGFGFAADIREVHIVHQRTIPSAGSARHMFRFEPGILHLEPGETVAFLNSLGGHTVMSQDGLWPEGAETVDIRGRARAEVTFELLGLYGITCARHGRYGMSMLISVGDAGPEEAAVLDVSALPTTQMAKSAYADLLIDVLEGDPFEGEKE